MGCPCQNKSEGGRLFSANSNSEIDCGYSYNTILGWKSLLECIKDNQRYGDLGLTVYDMNVFLGNIISALNNNICPFATQLNQIQPYILNAVNLNICQV
jgi:hypothetical protein